MTISGLLVMRGSLACTGTIVLAIDFVALPIIKPAIVAVISGIAV
jgi:hypothetical protein